MSKTKKNFEQSFNALEKLVGEFESGQLPLDEAVKKFEQGLMLANDLESQLKNVAQRVEILKKNFAKNEAAPTEPKS